MNPIVDEQNHGAFYDSSEWIDRQVLSSLTVKSTSCPKEEKIMYSPKKVYIKLFNKAYKIIGLFKLPETIEIYTDSFEEKVVVSNKLVEDEIYQHMFDKELFFDDIAKKTRRHLCTECPFTNCNYNLKSKGNK